MPYLIRPKRVEQKSTREKDDNKRLSNRIKHEKKPHARSHERTKKKSYIQNEQNPQNGNESVQNTLMILNGEQPELQQNRQTKKLM